MSSVDRADNEFGWAHVGHNPGSTASARMTMIDRWFRMFNRSRGEGG